MYTYELPRFSHVLHERETQTHREPRAEQAADEDDIPRPFPPGHAFRYPQIRTKVPPWRSDKDVNEFVSELHMDTAELSVRMSYEARKIQWNCEGLTQADMNASLSPPSSSATIGMNTAASTDPRLTSASSSSRSSPDTSAVSGSYRIRCTSRIPLTTRR